MDGREVLAKIKVDEELRSIPVVVLTTSRDPGDVLRSYDLHANAFVTKPINLDDLTAIVHQIDEFFTSIAALPRAQLRPEARPDRLRGGKHPPGD